MGSEQTLHQVIMNSGMMTGVMASKVAEEVIAWFANDENSLAYECLKLIKANAEVAELWIKQQDRITELEDSLVECAKVAQGIFGGGRIIEIVQRAAVVKETEEDNGTDGK